MKECDRRTPLRESSIRINEPRSRQEKNASEVSEDTEIDAIAGPPELSIPIVQAPKGDGLQVTHKMTFPDTRNPSLRCPLH